MIPPPQDTASPQPTPSPISPKPGAATPSRNKPDSPNSGTPDGRPRPSAEDHVDNPSISNPGLPHPRTSFGLATALLTVPSAVTPLNPTLAAILFTAEVTLVLLVMTATVFSPRTTGDRAFRLLRWMTGSPEPDPPFPHHQPHQHQKLASADR